MRPTISIPGVITPAMTQNKRLNPRQDVAKIALLWAEVVNQVTDQGLALGVHAELPRLKSQITLNPIAPAA